MKKILFILFTSICIYSCTTTGYKIDGNVDNKALNGTKIFIKERINRVWISLDSTVIENGKFSFKGVADTAKIANIVYEFPQDNKVRQAFVLEIGNITVNIDSTGFMVIKGTAQNNLLQSYQESKKAFNKKSDAFYSANKDSLSTFEQKLAFSKKEKIFNKEEADIDKKFVTENINTVAGTYVFTSTFYGFSTAEKDSIILKFNEITKQIPRIKEIIAATEKEKKVAVGNQFVDFRMPDTNGDSLSLSGLVGKTDYVLIDFWASWCPDCIASIPEIKSLYTMYKGPRFEILGVSLDDDKSAWKNAISSYQLDWKHVSDLKRWECAGSKAYAVNFTPTTVLIDKKGKIVGRNLSFSEIANLLSRKTH